MTARRVLEIRTNERVLIAYRNTTVRETAPGNNAPVAFTTSPDDPDDWLYMSADEVEALHQFTYGILAGRARDPRLTMVDAEIGCGFQWSGRDKVRHECALDDGHGGVTPSPHGEVTHVDRRGVPYVEVPF